MTDGIPPIIRSGIYKVLYNVPSEEPVRSAPKETHCPREPVSQAGVQGSSCLRNNSKSCLETPKTLALGKCHSKELIFYEHLLPPNKNIE